MWRLIFGDQSAHSNNIFACTVRTGADPDRAGLQFLGVIFSCVTATVTTLAIITVIQQVWGTT